MNDEYLHDVLREAEAAFETTAETRAEAIGRRSFLKLTRVAVGDWHLPSTLKGGAVLLPHRLEASSSPTPSFAYHPMARF